jgi:hypothetical protein
LATAGRGFSLEITIANADFGVFYEGSSFAHQHFPPGIDPR